MPLASLMAQDIRGHSGTNHGFRRGSARHWLKTSGNRGLSWIFRIFEEKGGAVTNSIWTLNPTGGVADGVVSCCQPFAFEHGHTRAASKPLFEPPTADSHGGWCGEGRLEAGPYPIGHRVIRASLPVRVPDVHLQRWLVYSPWET